MPPTPEYTFRLRTPHEHRLMEDGTVETLRYEGESEEAERIRQEG
jgi:hypothetical protein